MVMRPWQYFGFVSLIIHSMVEKSSTLCVSANGPVICHSIVPNEGQRMQSRVQVPDLSVCLYEKASIAQKIKHEKILLGRGWWVLRTLTHLFLQGQTERVSGRPHV